MTQSVGETEIYFYPYLTVDAFSSCTRPYTAKQQLNIKRKHVACWRLLIDVINMQNHIWRFNTSSILVVVILIYVNNIRKAFRGFIHF